MNDKLTQEELDKVSSLFKSIAEEKIFMAELDMSIIKATENKKLVALKIEEIAQSLEKELAEIESKYGKVKIDLSDGTLTKSE
jgi:hypothetical protein